jgi:hypothetical protein
MSVSNYILNQRISTLQYQINQINTSQQTTKSTLSFVSSDNITINTPSTYILAVKDNIGYMNPSSPYISITLNTIQTQYSLLSLSSYPSDIDYNFTIWTDLRNNITSTKVFLSCINGKLTLNVPNAFILDTYIINLPSFNYIIE